jgi:filamentous hemagglutinin family protein
MMVKSSQPSIRILLSGCVSAMAMAVVLGAPPVKAQTAFQGNPSVVLGSATITRGTTDTIEVNGAETVINWTPGDTSGTGAIDFLPAGLTAQFRNNPNLSGLTDYTVLNRILPVDGSGLPVSRVVAFNGTVQSQLYGSAGGNIWFYAPGGIIAGPTSVFNVGSLVLTSNDIDVTGGLYGSGRQQCSSRGAGGREDRCAGGRQLCCAGRPTRGSGGHGECRRIDRLCRGRTGRHHHQWRAVRH